MLWCVVLCVHVSTIILYVCVYVCDAGDRKLTVICLDVQRLSSESESFSVSFMLTNCVCVVQDREWEVDSHEYAWRYISSALSLSASYLCHCQWCVWTVMQGGQQLFAWRYSSSTLSLSATCSCFWCVWCRGVDSYLSGGTVAHLWSVCVCVCLCVYIYMWCTGRLLIF